MPYRTFVGNFGLSTLTQKLSNPLTFFIFQITALSWDHANSEVKIEISDDELVILTMAVSVEFEGELKLRLSGMQCIKGFKIPPTMYVGMFAGNVLDNILIFSNYKNM